MRERFLIVDGNSLMHRAFHALPMMDVNGVQTNAVHGFFMMLLRAMKEYAPSYCAVAFDEHAPTFRHTIYPEYKAGRQKTPDELVSQFPIIREILIAMRLGVLSLPGYEADDILGTLALKCGEWDMDAYLLTGDRDALQLVGKSAKLILTRKGVTEAALMDDERVKDEYGVSPAQITDLKGLMGDSSDNIPGVPGVGEKTAVKLLAQYETLENTLAHGDEIKGKLGEKIRAFADQARFSKELATIRPTVPLNVNPADYAVRRMNEGIPALRKYELNTIAARIEKEEGAPKAVQTEAENAPEWEIIADESALRAFAEGISGDPAIYAAQDAVTVRAGNRAVRIPVKAQLSLLDDGTGLSAEEALRALSPILSRPVITHDAKRLLHFLHNAGLTLPQIKWDTMLGRYLQNSQEKSYALAALAEESAQGVYGLYVSQRDDLQSKGMLDLYERVELPLARVLFGMELEGFRVDAEVLSALGRQFSAREAELQKEIYEKTGVPDFNISSPQQLGKVLFETLGLPSGRKTAKGYSTDADTLENLLDAHPAIAPILEYRKLTKLTGTYVDALLRKMNPETGRVRTVFDQTGTATGRISSSEPNLQNIPVRTELGREIRRAFVAREGYMLVDADYSQIELRLLAHLSGDEAMRDAFIKGQDVHARTAAEVYGVPIESVTKQMRSSAKAVNFGLVYGISDFGLARNIGVSRREAKAFIDRYFDRYPRVRAYMDEAVRRGYDKGYAETLLGRRRYLPELASSNVNLRRFGERVAMNTPIQGTAADVIKLAMVRTYDELKKSGGQARLILQVHDELIIEAPQEEVETVSATLKSCMEGAISLSVPLTCDVQAGKSWYETK